MWNKNKNSTDLLAWKKAFSSGGWEKEFFNIPDPIPYSELDENGTLIVYIDHNGGTVKLLEEIMKDGRVRHVILNVSSDDFCMEESLELATFLKKLNKPVVVHDGRLACILTSKSFDNKSVKVGDTAYFHKKLII